MKVIADYCVEKGGVKRYDLHRCPDAYGQARNLDAWELRQNDFDMHATYEDYMRIWSYNCQMANATRLRDWSRELAKCFVLMQGTSRTYDPDKGERGLQQWSTDDHDIIEAKVAKKTRGPQPDGVLRYGGAAMPL